MQNNSKSLSNSLSIFNDFSQFSKEIKNLRKINPIDKFPCFNCFDDSKEKLNCQQCKGLGYVFGSHPMVQFAEDFIDKKFASMGYNSECSPNNSYQSNPSAESIILNKMSASYDSKNNQIFPGKLTKTVKIIEDQRVEPIQKQQTQTDGEELCSNQYFCDECNSRKTPIKGNRYHCKQCQDYDLCENCFNRGAHDFHQFQEIKCSRKQQSLGFKAQNIRNTILKKTVKGFI